jgi:hypothetical protein
MSAWKRPLALALLVCLAACQQSLPTAPSDLQSGIVIYQHANFRGEAAHITESEGNLADFKGPCIETDTSADGSTTTTESWNDCISSVRVAPGWQATLYRDRGYDGDKLDVTGEIANLQLSPGRCDHDGFNDCATSIRVFRR